MSDKIRHITCLAVLATVATALSPSGFSEDAVPPTYRVANLLNVDPENGKSYARELSDQIANLSVHERSEVPYEEFGKCCKNAPKHGHCEEVSANVETVADGELVHIHVEEYLPRGRARGELVVKPDLTCAPSMSYVACYQSLVKRMAKAVEEHDVLCHRGKKCKISDGHFLPVPY